MFAGMHLAKRLWNAFGDLLEDSSYGTALTQAGVQASTSSGITDFLTQVCQSHLTVLALSTMQLQFSRSIIHLKISDIFFIWISYYILILIWAHRIK